MTTTTTEATMNRPGFAPVTLQFTPDDPETFVSYQGPQHGHVSTFLGDGGAVVVALDGLGNGNEGMDLDMRQARALYADLGRVLGRLDELAAPAVDVAARELAGRRRLLVTDVCAAADSIGVSCTAMFQAVESHRARLGAGQDNNAG